MVFLYINMRGLRKATLLGIRRGTKMVNSCCQYIQITHNFPQKSGYTQ